MRLPLVLLSCLLASACAARPPLGVTADPRLATAEALIDAFYSFDPARLRRSMAGAEASMPRILYYQGWAEGGHYVVLDRKPCRPARPEEIACDITVRDDLVAALRTGYDVTDTFHLTFRDNRLAAVTTTSNDPPEFDQARQWLVGQRPELLDGPCRGFFAGGPTPGDCVREVVRGFADWVSIHKN